jgi:hypothetical protein
MLLYSENIKLTDKNPGVCKCCVLLVKCAKTHVHASVNSNIFPGIISPDPIEHTFLSIQIASVITDRCSASGGFDRPLIRGLPLGPIGGSAPQIPYSLALYVLAITLHPSETSGLSIADSLLIFVFLLISFLKKKPAI